MTPVVPPRIGWLGGYHKEQGELELAKQYAARCYKALIEGDDFLKKERLETLRKKFQLEEARAEWRRRHRKSSSPANSSE